VLALIGGRHHVIVADSATPADPAPVADSAT
jgi:hypothetical protein